MDEIKGGITTMPCIQTKVSVKMTEQQEKTIKTELGKAISLIPGKSENWLMLIFEDDCKIYFQGNCDQSAAFVEVKIYGKANAGVYNKMTAAITDILSKELQIAPNRIYVKYEEVAYWGWNGNNF